MQAHPSDLIFREGGMSKIKNLLEV
jgi:hypothetical protein